jgi:hypothetical protein
VVISKVRRPYKMYCSSWPSSSGLRGRRRTYHTIFKLADHALFKMVRYVLLHSGLTSGHDFFLFHPRSIFVSISLTISLFSHERVKYSIIIAWKKAFLNERCLEAVTNYRAKAPRFSHHDCWVIEQKVVVQKSLKKTALVFF